jgi:hypothetical protein
MKKSLGGNVMKVKFFLCSLAIILTGACVLTSLAVAVTPNPECVQDAKEERNLCIVKCQEEFRVDKDACRDVDHDCADACREGFETCVEPFLTILTTCKAVCLTNLTTAKAACSSITDPVQRDFCIDGAQLAAFGCRDTCREDVASSLKACRIGFRACIKACPPPPVAP